MGGGSINLWEQSPNCGWRRCSGLHPNTWCPLSLYSGRSKELHQGVCDLLCIIKKYSTAYHFLANVIVEHCNTTLLVMLWPVVSECQYDRDDHLPTILSAYGSTHPFPTVVQAVILSVWSMRWKRTSHLTYSFVKSARKSQGSTATTMWDVFTPLYQGCEYTHHC